MLILGIILLFLYAYVSPLHGGTQYGAYYGSLGNYDYPYQRYRQAQVPASFSMRRNPVSTQAFRPYPSSFIPNWRQAQYVPTFSPGFPGQFELPVYYEQQPRLAGRYHGNPHYKDQSRQDVLYENFEEFQSDVIEQAQRASENRSQINVAEVQPEFNDEQSAENLDTLVEMPADSLYLAPSASDDGGMSFWKRAAIGAGLTAAATAALYGAASYFYPETTEALVDSARQCIWDPIASYWSCGEEAVDAATKTAAPIIETMSGVNDRIDAVVLSAAQEQALQNLNLSPEGLDSAARTLKHASLYYKPGQWASLKTLPSVGQELKLWSVPGGEITVLDNNWFVPGTDIRAVGSNFFGGCRTHPPIDVGRLLEKAPEAAGQDSWNPLSWFN